MKAKEMVKRYCPLNRGSCMGPDCMLCMSLTPYNNSVKIKEKTYWCKLTTLKEDSA